MNASDPTGLWIVDAYINSTFSSDEAERWVGRVTSPSDPQITFYTEPGLGLRRVDSYGILPNWLNEVKTGNVSNTAEVDLQMTKDVSLLKAGIGIVAFNRQYGTAVAGAKLAIRGDTWWVLPNEVGQSGMSKPERAALTQDGINGLILHYLPPGDFSPVNAGNLGRAAQSHNFQRVHSALDQSLLSPGSCGPSPAPVLVL